MPRATTRLTSEETTQALSADQLRKTCDSSLFNFSSTQHLKPIDILIGQDRAADAIRFGTSIDQPGYNMYVLGAKGTGRHETVQSFMEQHAAKLPAPDDWVYVNNFAEPHKPIAIKLPAGMALKYRAENLDLIEDLVSLIPSGFQSSEYRESLQAIDEEFDELEEEYLTDLKTNAEENDVELMKTPMGFTLAPLKNKNVIDPEEFNLLPEDERKAIEHVLAELQKELAQILENMPDFERQHRAKLKHLNSETIGKIVDISVTYFLDKFTNVPAIRERTIDLRNDVVENVNLFISELQDESRTGSIAQQAGGVNDIRFDRYMVNVVVANDIDGNNRGAPVLVEDHPTLANLVGRVEYISEMGTLVTDFTMIKPGALHFSNGGILIIDAQKILSEPFSWEALKRSLRAQTITIRSATDQLGLGGIVTLQPEPIPLSIKLVLIGDRVLYYLLSTLDPDFSELFKVQVDFDEELVRSSENIELYSRVIGTIAKKNNLLPLDAAAVAEIIDELSRMTEDSERISLKIGLLSDLLREADYWANEDESEIIESAHVIKSITAKIHRADRLHEKNQELVARGIRLIATEGTAIGQINALSVIELGNFSFGQPSRITVRVRMGSGEVVDIERETELGGPTHTKGVLILSSYIVATYAKNTPVSLWASIVFEQSYGDIDGDSASSAELYALLSSLSELPLSQSLSVTGSVNQFGQVQAIGGVNQKIEGFFDICKARGLTGDQGVLIPSSNVMHLMLRHDIVDAAKEGLFHVYPIENIEQGISLLTDTPAGQRDDAGFYPLGSVNQRVEERLVEFAKSRRKYLEKES